MRAELFFLVLFVIYCLEAGLFLLLAPWNPGWDRLAFQMSPPLLRELLLHGGFRGAISGFGLIHIVWGLYDLKTILGRWFRRRSEPSGPSPSE